ncbi:MAG TPA: hypothetical protein VMY76_14900 [Gemmatimonadales bacterium]|nr:hypothetical protein [Gemmatimonadales bacterium]
MSNHHPFLVRVALLLNCSAGAMVSGCTEPTAISDASRNQTLGGEPATISAATRLSIDGDRFRINGALTHPGQPAAGRLMNVRMVNSVFEDTGRPSFNSSANTDEFVGRMREYVGLGVRAFTISLQGGYPGYEGARNSAFLKNGDLKPDYLARVAQVIERADALGAAVILSLYYQRQDQALQDDEAIRSGLINVVDWVKRKGYRNVILEPANEYGHSGFDHAILRSDAGVAGLLRLAKSRYPALPVAASYLRNGQTTPQVAAASDLILTHFNSVAVSDIAARVKALRSSYPGKPIVCNEDAKIGQAAAAAATASVQAGASYGLMLERQNQFYPFNFEGRRDDPVAYDRYVALTR